MLHDSRVFSQWFVQGWTMDEITFTSSFSKILSSRSSGKQGAKQRRAIVSFFRRMILRITQYYVLFVLNHQLTTYQKFWNITYKIFQVMQLIFNFIETRVIKFLIRNFASNTARSWLIKLRWSVARKKSLTCMLVLISSGRPEYYVRYCTNWCPIALCATAAR